MELGESGIERLPELCVAHAISLASPRDACRLSAVSAAFRCAATSDTVWDRFLPTDWQSLVSRAVYPVEFSSSSSKRDIFFRLCDPILIDDGKMVRTDPLTLIERSQVLHALRQRAIHYVGRYSAVLDVGLPT
ncbi:hypothetical protein BHE74_00058034 [Ensete ventricosum]|nr:hypothetical protein BHE74_00058034 [Ensete ventricosum]